MCNRFSTVSIWSNAGQVGRSIPAIERNRGWAEKALPVHPKNGRLPKEQHEAAACREAMRTGYFWQFAIDYCERRNVSAQPAHRRAASALAHPTDLERTEEQHEDAIAHHARTVALGRPIRPVERGSILAETA